MDNSAMKMAAICAQLHEQKQSQDDSAKKRFTFEVPKPANIQYQCQNIEFIPCYQSSKVEAKSSKRTPLKFDGNQLGGGWNVIQEE